MLTPKQIRALIKLYDYVRENRLPSPWTPAPTQPLKGA